MKKFEFRLEKVLGHRESLEETAKNAYVRARLARTAIESEIKLIGAKRSGLLCTRPGSIQERRHLEQLILNLEGQVRELNAAKEVAVQDEASRFAEWVEARRDMLALRKLRERELGRWSLEADREEQKGLDEWAVQRRAA